MQRQQAVYFLFISIVVLVGIFLGRGIGRAQALATDCSVPWSGGKIAHFFATPFNIFNNNAKLLSIKCSPHSYDVTIGDGSKTLYIYKKVYFTEDADHFTRTATISGSEVAHARDWIIGSGTVQIPYFSSREKVNYLAFYACSLDAPTKQWRCGCSATGQCSQPAQNNYTWFLRGFVTQQPQPVKITPRKAFQTAQKTQAVTTSTQTTGGAQSTIVGQLPPCSGAQTLIIDSAEGWAQVNNAQYTNFCVKPGDYKSAGTITLTASGTAGKPRTIQLMGNDATHPVKLSQAQRAYVKGFLINGNHWVIDRMSIVNVQEPHTMGIEKGASDNTISRLYMDGNLSGIDIQDRANRNTITQSYIGNTTLEGINSDFVCVGLQAYQYGDRTGVIIEDTKITDNEFVNCNDSVQLIRKKDSRDGSFPGTIVTNNDFYTTDDRLTDCSGNRQPGGECMIGENAFDIKGGSDDPSRPVRIERNRIWNMKQSDRTLVPTGSWGDAIIVHFDSQNVIVKDNIIWDSSRGIDVHIGASNVGVENNVLYDINSQRDNVGQALMFTSEAGTNNHASGNIIVNARTPIENGSGAQLSNNSIRQDKSGGDLCFRIKRISGPEEKCLKGAK